MTTFIARREGRRITCLEDKSGTALYIGAESKQHVQDLLGAWGPRVSVELLSHFTSLHNDIDLPGGAMALVAIALEQWGPPP